MDNSTIEILPDADFRRVLCVAAHPDDIEYGTAAAVSRWVSQGTEVSYLLLTGGEAGMPRPPEQARVLRAAEQRAACDAVKVTDLTILDHPDGRLVYSLELRRDIARVIRKLRPDVVVAGAWDVEFAGGLNHADHRAAGLATLDAVRDADNTWVFPELEAEGLAKWAASWLLVAGSNQPTHGVDVTGEPLERGIKALEAHVGYLAGVEGHPAPRQLITDMTAAAGGAIGTANAVLFRAYRLR